MTGKISAASNVISLIYVWPIAYYLSVRQGSSDSRRQHAISSELLGAGFSGSCL